MSAHGKQAHRLTKGAKHYDSHPTWSPDGTKIAFVRAKTSFARGGDIQVMDVNGSDLTPLTHDGDAASPTWSPDGTKMAYVRELADAGDSEIWSMNIDGSGAKSLTDPGDRFLDSVGSPAWSPDGTKIAFEAHKVSTHDLYDSDITVMGSDGSARTPLTASLANENQPSWSPDGSKIAYEFHPIGGSENASDVYVMDADGSNAVELVGGIEHEIAPTWLPGGTKVGYVRQFENSWALLVFDVETSTSRVLLDGDGDPPSSMAWSPNDRGAG